MTTGYRRAAGSKPHVKMGERHSRPRRRCPYCGMYDPARRKKMMALARRKKMAK